MKSTWRKAPSIYNSRKLFKADHRLLYRRLGVCADNVKADPKYYQLNMFIDYEALAREKQLQGAISELRSRYGKNTIFKAFDALEGFDISFS